MIAPHKRTPIFKEWKEITRNELGLTIRDDRPFGVYKNGRELRVNTDHSVVIALVDGSVSVWNKPLQHAGKKLTLSELGRYAQVLQNVWLEIEGGVE